MRGTVKQRAKGTWTIILDVGRDPATGKRQQQWHTVKGTKREAETRLAELQHQLDTGAYVKPARTTVGDFLERWLRDYAWPSVAPRTAEGYEHIIKQYLIPSLGAIHLVQLAGQHLQAYYADKLARGRRGGSGGLSPTTVRHHHVVLHTALKSAVKWGLLVRNPADSVDPPRYQHQEMHTLDEEGMDTSWRPPERHHTTTFSI